MYKYTSKYKLEKEPAGKNVNFIKFNVHQKHENYFMFECQTFVEYFSKKPHDEQGCLTNI